MACRLCGRRIKSDVFSDLSSVFEGLIKLSDSTRKGRSQSRPGPFALWASAPRFFLLFTRVSSAGPVRARRFRFNSSHLCLVAAFCEGCRRTFPFSFLVEEAQACYVEESVLGLH
jgi:hypothetical protein